MKKEILDLYSDYLICSFSHVTATGLSKALDGQLSHDKITRFLSEEDLDSKQLLQLGKPVIRQYERDDAVLIFDDTLGEKPYTDENELMRQRLLICQQQQISYRYVLIDSGFSSKENMQFIRKDLKKHFMMPLKTNRLVALSEEQAVRAR